MFFPIDYCITNPSTALQQNLLRKYQSVLQKNSINISLHTIIFNKCHWLTWQMSEQFFLRFICNAYFSTAPTKCWWQKSINNLGCLEFWRDHDKPLPPFPSYFYYRFSSNNDTETRIFSLCRNIRAKCI